MALVSMKEMLQKAKKEHYAVGAFNIYNIESIEAVMGGPSANDYFSAALYYLQEDMDLNKAKMWIDKAVAMNDKAFWMSRQQSLIYAKLGDKAGAIKAAKKSLADAKAANNADYVKMNMDSLKEWGAM